MPASIEMDPNGLNLLMDRLDAGAHIAADLTPAWPQVGKVWAAREQRVFAQNKWPPLAASTLARKRRLVGNTPPLIRTGRLFTEASDPIAVKAQPRFAVFGVGEPSVKRYAHWHQRGAGVPKRQPVPRLTPTERKAVTRAIGDVVWKAIDART